MATEGRRARGSWSVYIVEGPRGSLYTGISTDVARRLREHGAGQRGARFFRLGRPGRLLYEERVPDRAAASRREAAIKRLSRAEKLLLIRAAGEDP
jgi:putative endonuclease